MKLTPGLACIVFLLTMAGCNVDPGPTETASDAIDTGKAESVHAEIHMAAGSLKIEGGASDLMTGNYRYSERVGRPVVRYDVTGAHGRLTVESQKGSSTGSKINDWDLQMASAVPLDMTVSLGAGESKLDMSQLSLRSLDVNMGAGQMTLNVAGRYMRDVTVQVNGGVGEARIQVPTDVGAVVEATGGIGSVTAKGLIKREGKYYNSAYTEGKPAVRMEVHGGIGDVILSAGE